MASQQVGHAGVTIVIPTRNRSALVGRAIESALAHRPTVSEVIVVDDGSSDATARVLAAYGADITVMTGRGEGVSKARNFGLSRATAAWVTFLDDDDVLSDDWSEVQPWLGDPHVGLICGAAEIRTSKSNEVVMPRDLGPHFNGIVGGALAGSWLARTSIVRRAGGYAAELRHSENVELFLRLAQELGAEQLTAASFSATLVRISGDSHGLIRGSADHRARVEAVRFFVAHHEETLLRHPVGYAALLRTGAVSAARIADRPQARAWFATAARIGDQRWRDLARLAATCSRWTSRRAWLPDDAQREAPMKQASDASST
jgi:glycosyltransferase involved in cell wall biosynthesis